MHKINESSLGTATGQAILLRILQEADRKLVLLTSDWVGGGGGWRGLGVGVGGGVSTGTQ